MINIKIIHLEKHKNKQEFELVENGIYKNLKDNDDTNYRIALSYELEDGEGQYPLEDILDKYYLHVSDFLDADFDIAGKSDDIVNLELAGTLEAIHKVAALVGKRVFNKECTEEDGKVYFKFIIE